MPSAKLGKIPAQPLEKKVRHQPRLPRLYLVDTDGEDLENLRKFWEGGYCPVHIGDLLDGDRYRVVHKLGHGGFGVVWLCLDQHTSSYVAIKISISMRGEQLLRGEQAIHEACEALPLQADRNCALDYFCLTLRQFQTESPNGTHTCRVFPVLGPTIVEAGEMFSDDVPTLRHLLRQTAEALAQLHRLNVGHGDLRPSNILLDLKTLSDVNSETLLSELADPLLHLMACRDEGDIPPCAPKYLVEPIHFTGDMSSIVLPRIKLIDFDLSFDASTTEGSSGIPMDYASPEAVFGKVGLPSDCWSLACIIYEIRLGEVLFGVPLPLGRRCPDEYLLEIASTLGKPPEDLCSGLESDLSKLSCVPIRQRITDSGEDIDDQEADELADLLGKLLKYDPAERISASEALDHPWFRASIAVEEGA